MASSAANISFTGGRCPRRRRLSDAALAPGSRIGPGPAPGLRRLARLLPTADLHTLPPACRQHSVAIAAPGGRPESRQTRRRLQHLAGRLCAARALGGIRPALVAQAIGTGALGEPIWPAGIVGSITHTDDFASAAVCEAQCISGIGIDSEPMATPEAAAEIAPLVARPEEWSCIAAQARLTPAEAITLIFSAKESAFKCLAPLAGRHFDLLDVALIAADWERGALLAELKRPLAAHLPVGIRLEGGFCRSAGHFHTHFLLRRSRR